MNTLKKLLLFSLLAISLVAFSGCGETMDGAGQDIENAGEEIQDATN